MNIRSQKSNKSKDENYHADKNRRKITKKNTKKLRKKI